MEAKSFWIEMAKTAEFRASNNMAAVGNSSDEIRAKYELAITLQAARLYQVAAYCLIRYSKLI